MATNLCVYYQYRDADNYKRHGHVVLANPSECDPAVLRAALAQAFPRLQSFPDIVAFDPEALGWPNLYFDGYDLDGADVPFHELGSMESTNEFPNVNEDVESLLQRLRELRIP